jgi:hypothetical protein
MEGSKEGIALPALSWYQVGAGMLFEEMQQADSYDAFQDSLEKSLGQALLHGLYDERKALYFGQLRRVAGGIVDFATRCDADELSVMQRPVTDTVIESFLALSTEKIDLRFGVATFRQQLGRMLPSRGDDPATQMLAQMSGEMTHFERWVRFGANTVPTGRNANGVVNHISAVVS